MHHDADDQPEGMEALGLAAIGPRDTYTKWIVGIVGAAMVALLAYFASSDRSNIEQRLKIQADFALRTTERMAIAEYRLNEQQVRLERMEKKLDEILDRLPPKKGI